LPAFFLPARIWNAASQWIIKNQASKFKTDLVLRQIFAILVLVPGKFDTSDIPEIRDWSHAAIGKFYRPVKEPVSLRLDADVLDWLKRQGPGYQTRINSLLRSAMTAGISARQMSKGANRERNVKAVRRARPASHP